MIVRKTLPQQRAEETRRLIIEAAERAFARKGYGEATVDDIIAEAGTSRGAFYHHFPNKEGVFRALLQDHVKDELIEQGSLTSAASLREVVERVVRFQIDHLKSERESGALSLEFWAHAGREDWAREAVAEFHSGIRETLARGLRGGQELGAVRRDLDPAVGAYLLLALYEGIAVLQALEPDGIDIERLAGPWSELIERFVSAPDGGE